jgi:hypothetical protein
MNRIKGIGLWEKLKYVDKLFTNLPGFPVIFNHPDKRAITSFESCLCAGIKVQLGEDYEQVSDIRALLDCRTLPNIGHWISLEETVSRSGCGGYSACDCRHCFKVGAILKLGHYRQKGFFLFSCFHVFLLKDPFIPTSNAQRCGYSG